MAFVFYDTETTGTNVYFDQVLQFAAILTDDELNELERFEVRSRIQPHTVANPGAMNVTGVTAAQLDDPTLPSHFEMACAIHAKLSEWEPALFVGHNSIPFDEVLLRSLFYKSLLPIYLTNMNGNCRLDTLKMLQSASIYEPSQISFPLGANGKPVYKLDQLAPANGFDHANAHEAMSDVEATLFMCRKVRDCTPDTWSRYMRFSNKSSVHDLCESEEVFGLTEFYFGRPHTFLLHKIGVNPDNSNEIVAVDLYHSYEDLKSKSQDEIIRMAQGSPKLFRKIRANALPGIIDGDEAHPYTRLSDESLDNIEQNANQLRDDVTLKERLFEAFLTSRTEYETSPHIEEQMYSGLASPEDQSRFQTFHASEWHERYDVVCQIADERYRWLGEWIIYCEKPDYLGVEKRLQWDSFVQERLLGTGTTCDALCLPKALQLANDLVSGLEGSKLEVMIEHRDRIQATLDGFGPT